MRRRLAIALSVSMVILAIAPGAGLARGPQKNDSVSGHGIAVDEAGTTTYEFRVSAHAVSSTTTLATGNMFLRITQTSGPPLGTVVIGVWADVFCVSTLTVTGEVRGHVYRSDGSLFDGQDLVFNVTDLSRVSDAPDLFTPTVVDPLDPTAITNCTEAPLGGETEVDKGNITVHDE